MSLKHSLIPAALIGLGLAFAGSAHADAITVYSAGPKGLIDNLAKGYTAKSGTEVNVFQGTTGQVMARMEAEAANPVVDVLISASWETASDFEKRGWLVKYTPAKTETVPAFLKTEYAVAQGVSALALVWNKNSGVAKPTDWADLAKPEYKDLVTMPDPAQSGSSFELVAGLRSLNGGKMDLFRSLSANGTIVPGANAQALNPVMQGAKAVVFGAVDYIAMGSAAKGEAIEVVFPSSGTIIAPRPAMILNWTKNEAGAKGFMDYMLSDEGQAMVAKVFLMPARTDVKADRLLIGDLKLLDIDTASAYAAREQILAEFKAAMGL